MRGQGIDSVDPALSRVSHQECFNDSPLSLRQLLGEAPKLSINVRLNLQGFSSVARAAIETFGFDRQIDKREQSWLLYQVRYERYRVEDTEALP